MVYSVAEKFNKFTTIFIIIWGSLQDKMRKFLQKRRSHISIHYFLVIYIQIPENCTQNVPIHHSNCAPIIIDVAGEFN